MTLHVILHSLKHNDTPKCTVYVSLPPKLPCFTFLNEVLVHFVYCLLTSWDVLEGAYKANNLKIVLKLES